MVVFCCLLVRIRQLTINYTEVVGEVKYRLIVISVFKIALNTDKVNVLF